ncbi:MAG: type II toxin-antitoxin system VapC family toxin [Geminicoccaceae bacterium]
MVIDTSAFLAILLQEPEAPALIEAIVADPVRLASAATAMDASLVVLSRRGEMGLGEFRAFAARANVDIVPFGPEHVEGAVDAFRRFGKGRHPAALNFGDCFAYALAKTSGEPLLFKGEDFARTDIARAI